MRDPSVAPTTGIRSSLFSFPNSQRQAPPGMSARTTYNVDHPTHWGAKVSAYLFTKSLAAGLFFAAALLVVGTTGAVFPIQGISILALLFLGATTALLVADLKRPERFLSVLTRANWNSWLARGSVILLLYTALLGLCHVIPERLYF